MSEEPKGWNGPLTAKQLVYIIWVCVVIGFAVYAVIRAQQSTDRTNAQVTCDMNAPPGWDCKNYPTGYPTTSTPDPAAQQLDQELEYQQCVATTPSYEASSCPGHP